MRYGQGLLVRPRDLIFRCAAALFVLSSWTRAGAAAPEALLRKLEQAVYAGNPEAVFETALALRDLGDPAAIPALIGVIDCDNSELTVYYIGCVALSPLAGVPYEEFQHGPWWRKWWEVNKDRFPPEVRSIRIPDLPRTPHGEAFAKSAPDPASISLEPALEELLAMLEARVRDDRPWNASLMAMAVARRREPRAIPTLIGLIDADNSSEAIYEIGRDALAPLTGVRFDHSHHGPWWRKWWEANKERFPPEAQAEPIPDLPRTPHGELFARTPPDPDSIVLEPTLDQLLERLAREVGAGEQDAVWNTARWIGELEDPRAIPRLIELIEADGTETTIYGIGCFALSPLTDVEYDAAHDGAWWRTWWRENEARGAGRIPRHLRPVPDADDVAAVPAQDLRAAGDPDKRYLLIGPTPAPRSTWWPSSWRPSGASGRRGRSSGRRRPVAGPG